MTRTRLGYRAAWFGVLGAVAATGAIVPSAGSADSPFCPGAESDGLPTPPGDAHPLHLVVAQPAEGTVFRLRFGDSPTALRQQIFLALDDGQEVPSGLNDQERLNARFGGPGWLRGPNRVIGPTGPGIQTFLERRSSHELGLCLRLDPAVLHVPPGSYEGSFGVAYKSEMLSAVNVEATFRGPWRKAAFFAFLGVFLGLIVKTLSEAAAIARTGGIRAREALRIYMSRLEFPVIVILAAIAGTFVYVVQYLHDPDWGAEGTDTLRLFATCFVVQMGSSEALSVVSRVAGGLPAPPASPSGG